MDASKFLSNQGWRGLGYSLDKNNRGITHPLMVKHKDNKLGLGKEVRTLPSDQWWMRAFDESLEMMGTGASTTLSNVTQRGMTAGGGLYTFFVRGQGLEGTIEEANKVIERLNMKRKRGSNTDPSSADRAKRKRERREEKAEKKAARRDERRREKESKREKRREEKATSRKEKKTESSSESAANEYLPTPAPSPSDSDASDHASPQTSSLTPKQLSKLKERAQKKGLGLEEYLDTKRRKEARSRRRKEGSRRGE